MARAYGITVLLQVVRFNLRSIFFRTSLQLKMLMMRREGLRRPTTIFGQALARGFPPFNVTVAEAFVLHLL
jgi:hypothetical protein